MVDATETPDLRATTREFLAKQIRDAAEAVDAALRTVETLKAHHAALVEKLKEAVE
jgi:hypothetical protein